MESILISTSKFGTAIPDYFKYLGEEFNNKKFSVVFIFDGRVKNLPPNEKNIKYFTYPNKRPTRLKDFIFICKIIKKEKPVLCISNFGSTNIVTIASYVFRVSLRINYFHTSPQQLKIDSKRNLIYNWFLRQRKILILKINTHVITNSSTMSDLITKSYKIEKDKISVLPYLLEKSKNNWRPLDKREFSICIVGRLSLSKGHKNLLYAFNECIKIDPKLKLLIVGDGPEKNTLQKLTKSLKQKSHVVFLGNIPNKEIGTIFSNCFASISASKSEAFGIVNIESLREGTPVICTNTEGAKDIIVNGKNGFIVNLTKKNDLAKKIELVLKNWEKYSNNALQTFEKEYEKHNISFHCQTLVNELKKKSI
tara:strand:- start:5757 stop:6854 length:1098 start_codon:yes stop_codon:yes gene_type:complete